MTSLSIGLDRAKKIPLATQIYAAIRAAIESGQIPAEAKLPSWRDLATQLGVSRGTVRLAYERLIDEHLATSFGAAGTRVADRPAASSAGGRPAETPPMPDLFARLAREAAAKAGFADFYPEACLINRYEPGAKLSLHQDKDELDFAHPIVSVSLGLPATFLFGGMNRSDKTARYRLTHGDVVVWGGPSRLAYHGVMPLADGEHPLLGRQRINLTFRKTR